MRENQSSLERDGGEEEKKEEEGEGMRKCRKKLGVRKGARRRRRKREGR